MTIAAIRFNNPGNVSLPIQGYNGPGTIVGLSGQPGYASFPTMADGFNALQARVTNYIDAKGLNTISALNSVYAQDPNWSAGVSKISGIPANAPLDTSNQTQMQQLQAAIVQQETGIPASSLQNAIPGQSSAQVLSDNNWNAAPMQSEADMFPSTFGQTLSPAPGYDGSLPNGVTTPVATSNFPTGDISSVVSNPAPTDTTNPSGGSGAAGFTIPSAIDALANLLGVNQTSANQAASAAANVQAKAIQNAANQTNQTNTQLEGQSLAEQNDWLATFKNLFGRGALVLLGVAFVFGGVILFRGGNPVTVVTTPFKRGAKALAAA